MTICTKLGRALLTLTAAVAVGLSGCGEDKGANNGGGNGDGGGTTTPGTTPGGGGNSIVGNNNCTSAEKCKSKEMPDGKVWMTENLNIETADSWCFNNSADSCVKYGRLYTWNAATTACPSGWHLPSRDEWGALAIAAGGRGDYGRDGPAGKALKSTSGWFSNLGGTDQYGFTALPGGFRRPSDGSCDGATAAGYLWTATESDSGKAYYRSVGFTGDLGESTVIRDYGHSVRCIKN